MKNEPYTDPNAGLEGKDTHVTFHLERYKAQHTVSGVNGRLLRNGEPVGMVNVKNEKELEILRSRINGSYNLDTGAFTIIDWGLPEEYEKK